jgi:hypothetical protein
MSQIVPYFDLIPLIGNLSGRNLLENLFATTARAHSLEFTQGDFMKGAIYIVGESGNPDDPLVRVSALIESVGLTDGVSIAYAKGDHIISHFPTTNPFCTFHLLVDSDALTTALAGVPKIEAQFECKITLPSSFYIGDPAFTQKDTLLREPCTIFSTGLGARA